MGGLELAKYRQYAASVSNINEQLNLLNDPTHQLVRGKTLEVIEEYIKKIKDPNHDNINFLKDIEFIPREKLEPGELEEMCDMGANDLPFYYFTRKGIIYELDQGRKGNENMKY